MINIFPGKVGQSLGLHQLTAGFMFSLTSAPAAQKQWHPQELNLSPWLARVRLDLLDFERHTLWDANAHSSTQDTVSGDLPLSSILHYCPKEACPVGAEHSCWHMLTSRPLGHTRELLENRAKSPCLPLPHPLSTGADAMMLPWVSAALGHLGGSLAAEPLKAGYKARGSQAASQE